MGSFKTFEKDLQLATAGISPAAVNAQLAKYARSELARAIAAGEARPSFDRYVNGRRGAPEESVIAPGPILYVFQWWAEVIAFALEYLIKRSPEKSGDFRRGWFAMVNGGRVIDLSAIPVDATVTLTNDRPFARKVEVGHMRMRVPHGVVEDGRLAVRRQYGAVVEVRKSMIRLPGGYVLKGVFRRGVRPQARKALKADTQSGQQVTYPALVLTMKNQ